MNGGVRVVSMIIVLAAVATTATAATRAIWLVDDFEDCTVDNWTAAGGPCTAIATSINPGGGTCSMEVFGDCGGQYDGWYVDFVDFAAETISASLRSQSTTLSDTYFVVGYDAGGGFNPAIFLKASAIGAWTVTGASTACGAPYTALQWYDFVFTVHWSSKTFDVSIDGTPCVSEVPFLFDIPSFNQIHAYNLADSAGWYDDIMMSTAPPQPPIFVDDFELGNTSKWSTSQP